jgi:hypothetical protein
MADARLAELLDRETRVWRALVAGDGATDERLLSDDFLGVYPTGFANRADHVAQLDDGPTMSAFSITDARMMELADAVVLLAYRAEYRRVDATHDEVMYISSVWAHRGGDWVNVFSQDTPAPHP